VDNILDAEEVDPMLKQLLAFVNVHKICAICTIHANEGREQTDEFGNLSARGHFKGLHRKGSTFLHLRAKQGYATLTFGKCRGEIANAVFNVGYADGEPYMELSTETADEYAKERSKYSPIVKEIPLTGLSYKELTKLIIANRKVSESMAKKDITAMTRSCLVISKDGVYYDTDRQPKEC
jgi:hypothetical protein